MKSIHLFPRSNNLKSETPALLYPFLACRTVTLKKAGYPFQKTDDELKQDGNVLSRR